MEGVSSEERCTLVSELVQVLEMARQLDAHMGGQGYQLCGGGGEERCRALVATMRASIDRSVHIARSCYAERLPVLGQPESPPSGGGDGSPRSAGSDQAGGDSRGRGNATGAQSKKRKTLPKMSTQVRVSAVQDVTPLDDGLSWRKYGQKDILGAKYPRAYFRCTHRHTQGCQASKQVQRTDGDPLLYDVIYNGNHTCPQAQAQAAANQQATTQPQPGMMELQATASPMLPFPLLSNNLANDDGCETTSGFPAAFMPTTATPESQLVSSCSSNYTNTVGAGNVPEVELGSATNSPMGELDFMFSLDDAADFLENPSNYF